MKTCKLLRTRGCEAENYTNPRAWCVYYDGTGQCAYDAVVKETEKANIETNERQQ